MRYVDLAHLYELLENTSKRLLKIKAIAELLKKTAILDMSSLVLLLQGNIFPAWSEEKIGVAAKMVIKAIVLASGKTVNQVEKAWKKVGDLGLVAQDFIGTKHQQTLGFEELTLHKVFTNLHKVARSSGEGSVDRKINLVSELLTNASPLEARYIVRTVLEDLRVGVGDGSIRDAIVWAFFGKELGLVLNEEKLKLEFLDKSRDKYTEISNIVQHAYDVSNDFGIVARVAKEKGIAGLKEVHLKVGSPIKVMLYQKAHDIKDAFKIVGKPAALEYKYDGFRMQIHKKDKEVVIFTRRLENVTQQFPDVKKRILEHVKAKDVILDCEAVGYDPHTKKYLPFQNISQRIKRKHDIQQVAKKFPIEVNVFDVIELDEKNLLEESFAKRRNIIEKIIDTVAYEIIPAKQLITDDVTKAQHFYEEALRKGNEGVMVKSMQAHYKPGSRVGYGVKVKPTMENLDLVITGAEWGTGKRAGWLTSFTLACQDEDGTFLEIGKVGTGFKEKEDKESTTEAKEAITFEEMTKLLKPLLVSEKGRDIEVQPKVIVEISYEEIQKSPSYESGFALRFPRVLRLRQDKHVSEIAMLSEVEDLYYGQGR